MRLLCFILTALLLVLHSAAASAKSRTFLCNDGSKVTITVLGKNAVRATNLDGQTMTLSQSKTEKWYFLNGDYSVRISPDQSRADIGIPDWGINKCVAEGAPRATTPSGKTGSFPLAAQSWGGFVRSGPGENYKKVAKLKEGEEITVLSQASAPFFQDRPWFKIRYRGRTGYHWGGIICPKGKSIPGTYKVCN